MFSKTSFAAAIALATAVIASPAAAANPDINVNNRSGLTIIRVEMSGVGHDTWGPDLLGTRVLRAGYKMNWVTPSYPSANCRYDLRVTFASGRRVEYTNFNACAVSDATVFSDGIVID